MHHYKYVFYLSSSNSCFIDTPLHGSIPGFLSELGGLSTGEGGVGVCVGVCREHLAADVVLYETERLP